MNKQKTIWKFVSLSVTICFLTNMIGFQINTVVTWYFRFLVVFLGILLFRKLRPHNKYSTPKTQAADLSVDSQREKMEQLPIPKAGDAITAQITQPEETPAEEKAPAAPTEEERQEVAPAAPNEDNPQENTPAATAAEETHQAESKPRSGPFMRVHNGSIMLSRMMADMLSYDRPDLPMYDGFGYSFQFPVMVPPYPDTNIEGVMRFHRKDDTAIILISAEKGHSGKLHSIIITPPDAPKEEVIRWLRDETSWPIIEEKWWELYAVAEED